MDDLSLAPWFRAPFKAVSAFLAFGLFGGLVSSLLGIWALPVAGFCAAFGFVLGAFVSVPRLNLSFAFLSLVCGSLLAWWLLRNSYWPESHPTLAYQPTLVPLWCTLGGGVAGLLLAIIAKLKQSQRFSV